MAKPTNNNTYKLEFPQEYESKKLDLVHRRPLQDT